MRELRVGLLYIWLVMVLSFTSEKNSKDPCGQVTDKKNIVAILTIYTAIFDSAVLFAILSQGIYNFHRNKILLQLLSNEEKKCLRFYYILAFSTLIRLIIFGLKLILLHTDIGFHFLSTNCKV